MADSKYQLYFNTDGENYSGDEVVEIGKIVDASTGSDAMYIYYDRALYRTRKLHVGVEIRQRGDEEVPVALVDDMYRNCLYEQPMVFLALMLHELGHYMNGDLFVKGVDAAQLKREREENIINGVVSEMELKADAFAVKHVGKNTFMRAIDYMIKKRKLRANDPGKEWALREFELRKKSIQRMK